VGLCGNDFDYQFAQKESRMARLFVVSLVMSLLVTVAFVPIALSQNSSAFERTAPIPGMKLRRSVLSPPPDAADMQCISRANEVPLPPEMWILNRVEFLGNSDIASATFYCRDSTLGERFSVRPKRNHEQAAKVASDFAKSVWGMDDVAVKTAILECPAKIKSSGERAYHKMTACGVGGAGLYVDVLPPSPVGLRENSNGDKVMACEATIEKSMITAPGKRNKEGLNSTSGRCFEVEFSCPSRSIWHDKAGPSVDITTSCKLDFSSNLQRQIAVTLEGISGKSSAVSAYVNTCVSMARKTIKKGGGMPNEITVGNHTISCDQLADNSGLSFTARPKLD
jgi:hypothetical protein